MLYKKNDFHTRPVAEVKKDIDCMADYRDRILRHFESGTYDMEAINAEYRTLAYDEEKFCYQMVFRWLTEGDRQAIFLQDAKTMVLRPDWLAEILRHIRLRFPEIQRITSYGRANTLAKIAPDDYAMLREAGLNRIHSGYESGSDIVLQLIAKGTTTNHRRQKSTRSRDTAFHLFYARRRGTGAFRG